MYWTVVFGIKSFENELFFRNIVLSFCKQQIQILFSEFLEI